MAELTDEKLIQRARHAGRNLSALAALASGVAILFLAALAFIRSIPPFFFILGLSTVLVAGGYWVLAVAARRGDPKSVGIVIVVMTSQIVLSMIASGIIAARTGTPFQLNYPGFVVPIIVLLALSTSRRVLLDLQKRGLWESVFGNPPPTANLCKAGGALLVAGIVILNGGAIYANQRAVKEDVARAERARDFVRLINEDEQQFMDSMKAVWARTQESDIENALVKVTALGDQTDKLRKAIPAGEPLAQIVETYGNGVQQWKNALKLLSARSSERERIDKMIKLGDKLRADALEAFNRKYAGDRKSAR